MKKTEIKLPPNALEVFIKRYSLRDEHGRAVETVRDIFSRVARVVAESENQYRDGVDPKQIYEQFRQHLFSLRFVPNGRTIANAGTGSGQLANCFVLPIEDDLGKMENSIFATLRNAVLILQSGGGVGFSFGRIRHKGAFISTSKGKATGAVSFLKIYDTAFWVIGQGGGRRSACMAVLPVDHPDIYDFVTCKEQEGEIEHFNISVGITDEFMEAVSKNKSFDLRDPHSQKTVKTIKAQDLFDTIATFAHHNGEPGLLFLDAANRENPVPEQYTLEATNPCGEQWLGPGENCCMASINLREHTKAKKDPKKTLADELYDQEIDWSKLQETVEVTTRFLDDVIDANKYVSAVPMLAEAAFKNRRIGISIMGLADLMYLVGVAYGSQEGEDLAGQVMEFIRYHSLKTSIKLAKERGVFPGITKSVYNPEQFTFKLNKSLVKPSPRFKRPKLNWTKLISDIKKHGLRNAAQNTIAPTGAIATVTGLEGYGCEPVFSLSYMMKTHEGADYDNGEDFKKLYYESQLFAQALQKAGLSKAKREKVFSKVRESGTCQNIDGVPDEIKNVFVVSADLTASQHVRMQAALQRFVDNSISKTINFPATATIDDVKKAYLQAWKLGCKGLTVYVTGSRQQVVLESGKQDKEPYSSKEIDFRGRPLVKKQVVPVKIKVCPECGAPMQKAEGCITCPECGWSKCDV
ncbi:adenosylcobalamin-dependent ribonucleoside-diphosphate reductase [Candidatus Beckwithbacteria bacterium]|nr:adenosylcobalamin-dependent ribonucleoside-diphosphate reductase [Candidatus Beckwithbacteria bacterium]